MAPTSQQQRQGKGDKIYNPSVPKPLQAKMTKTTEGQNICCAFNMGGRTAAEPGGRRPRGLHVCAEPGWGKRHGLRQRS